MKNAETLLGEVFRNPITDRSYMYSLSPKQLRDCCRLCGCSIEQTLEFPNEKFLDLEILEGMLPEIDEITSKKEERADLKNITLLKMLFEYWPELDWFCLLQLTRADQALSTNRNKTAVFPLSTGDLILVLDRDKIRWHRDLISKMKLTDIQEGEELCEETIAKHWRLPEVEVLRESAIWLAYAWEQGESQNWPIRADVA